MKKSWAMTVIVVVTHNNRISPKRFISISDWFNIYYWQFVKIKPYFMSNTGTSNKFFSLQNYDAFVTWYLYNLP